MARGLPALLAILAVPAQGQSCDGTREPVSADGRILGHLPYGDASPADLVNVPSQLAVGGCRVRRDMLPDLTALLDAAANDPATGGRILALSCQRPLTTQTAVFCKEGPTRTGEDRAISAAPPGHSEHATGYAVDFAVRPANGCPDAETCMAATQQYKWLAANAPRYGFEMSFPIGTKQNVKWEPWHWRWVGRSADAPGAAKARFIFARARHEFAANPAVDPAPPPVPEPAIAPSPVPTPATAPTRDSRRKPRR